MKVMFIPSDNNPSSGAFLSMVALNKLLMDKFKVEIIVVLPIDGDGTKLLDEAGIKHVTIRSFDWVIDNCDREKMSKKIKWRIKKLRNSHAVREIAKLAKKEKVDVIHLNTTYPYVGALAALKAHIPFVWHLREFLEEDQRRSIWNKSKGYKLLNQADRVIAISTSVYNKYKTIIDEKKLCTILNGIDTDKFYRADKCIFSDEKTHLIYGGGYARSKGIYELASALKLLVDMGVTDFDIKFIGEANKKYKDHLRKIGLNPYVKYLGYQKNVTPWYEQSDIAFSTSACEAFGRKTVEAMLAGTLMIAANTGGTMDIIEDGKTGILYEQGNPIQLAFKILFAMKNREACQAMAKNGRAFAYENLSAHLNAKKVYDVYKSILREKRKK